MRNTTLQLLGGLCALSLVGCSQPMKVNAPSDAPIDWKSFEAPASVATVKGATEKERAIADAYFAALAKNDLSGLRTMLDDQVHFSLAGFVDRRGKADAIKSHQALFGQLQDRHFSVGRVFLTESSQLIEWVLSATHAESKKAVSLKGVVMIWANDEGSISDIHLYVDEALLAAQIGTAPKGFPPLPAPAPVPARVTFEQANSKEEDANVEVLRKLFDALKHQDESAFASQLADDVEIATLEFDRPMRGKAEARTWFRNLHHSIDTLDTLTDNLWGIGDFVVVEYHVVGAQRAPIGWVPVQKDNIVKAYFVDIVQLRAGKIAHVWRYDNPSQLIAPIVLTP